jgi:hypothetical protein
MFNKFDICVYYLSPTKPSDLDPHICAGRPQIGCELLLAKKNQKKISLKNFRICFKFFSIFLSKFLKKKIHFFFIHFFLRCVVDQCAVYMFMVG